MRVSSGHPQASASNYDQRQASADRWQLMEPLPTERAALEAELQRLDAKLSGLEDEANAEFQFACEVLSQRKRVQEQQAHMRFDRVNDTLAMLFSHECDQVNARYAERCEQLKQDMAEELQREIRRLKYTRDGVSVMDRRRLVRRSGGGSNSTLGGSASAASSGQVGGEDASSQDPYYSNVSTTAAQLAEKKRMDVLLSAAPIFQRLNKTLGDAQVADDLERIKGSMPSGLKEDDTGAEKEENDAEKEENDAQCGYESEEEREMEVVRMQLNRAESGRSTKLRLLAYDPTQLDYGLEVVVYRTATRRKNRQRPEMIDYAFDQDADVASGEIMYIFPDAFEIETERGYRVTVALSDWKSGRVGVYTFS